MKNLLVIVLVGFLVGCNESDNPEEESIPNLQAQNFYHEAQLESKKGVTGWAKALDLYNQADSLQPKNPIILHARGQFKIMSQIDIEGGLEDHALAIKYSKDSLSLKYRYFNRALDYLSIGDICSACKDWERSIDSEKYLKKYCERKFEKNPIQNGDNRITLTLNLEDSISYIESADNSGSMSSCNGKLIITNNSHPTVTIKGGLLDFGHEIGSSSSLYPEAIDSVGSKFHFFKSGWYSESTPNSDFKLESGTQFEMEIDVFKFHHFAYPGNYKVRLCLRPSSGLKGLNNTYFSNWQAVQIFRE